MAIIITNNNTDGISFKYLIWVLILSMPFGITFLLRNGATQEKSTGFPIVEVHEKFVKIHMNNQITELQEKFSGLDATVAELRKNLTEQIKKLAMNALMEIIIGDFAVMSELEEFEKVLQSQFESLQKRTLFLEDRQLDNSNMEELVKNLKESRTAMSATITDLKQVTSSKIDKLRVLIKELMAKCKWLQEKILNLESTPTT